MRDNHEGMPELLDAYERGGHYFGAIRVTFGAEPRAFEFGVPMEDYKALRRILQTRPFDQLPGVPYRYFLAGGISKRGEYRAAMYVRIEEGCNGQQVQFEMPLSLARNLYWFIQLKDFTDASHLPVIGASTQDS